MDKPVDIGQFKWDEDSEAVVVSWIPSDLDVSRYQKKGKNSTIYQAEQIANLISKVGGVVHGIAALQNTSGIGEYVIPSVVMAKISREPANYFVYAETNYNGERQKRILNVADLIEDLNDGKMGAWYNMTQFLQNLYGGQGVRDEPLTMAEMISIMQLEQEAEVKAKKMIELIPYTPGV